MDLSYVTPTEKGTWMPLLEPVFIHVPSAYDSRNKSIFSSSRHSGGISYLLGDNPGYGSTKAEAMFDN